MLAHHNMEVKAHSVHKNNTRLTEVGNKINKQIRAVLGLNPSLKLCVTQGALTDIVDTADDDPLCVSYYSTLVSQA